MSTQLKAQVTTSANNSGFSATDYVGWNTSPSNPLRIKHEGNYGIEFYTNTGAGTFGTPKMMLAATGELGLGTGTTTPASWLHVAPSGSTESFRTVSSSTSTADAWRMFRGTQEIGRLWIGNTGNAFNIYSTRGHLHLSTGAATTATTNCAEFVGGTGSDRGWLGLGDWNNLA